MKMKKILIAIGIFVIGGGFLYYSTNNISNAEKSLDSNKVDSESEGKIILNFSEVSQTAEQLIDRADIIAVGIITEKLEEFNYRDYNKSNLLDDETVILCSLYNCEIKDVLKGEKVEKVRLSFGGNSLPETLELNKEYTICLVKAPFMEDDVYSASINQGIFFMKDDELVNNVEKSFKVEDFKSEIEKVIEKNIKGIDIPRPGILATEYE